MKTARPSRASVVSTILVVLATLASAAWASPDHCGVVAGGAATCQGNQSNGIVSGQDVPANTSSITVHNLTSEIHPQSGKAGIYHVLSNAGGFTLHTIFDGGVFPIFDAFDTSAPGILVRGPGATGGSGRPGSALASSTVSSTGIILISGSKADGHGIAVDAVAGSGGAGSGGGLAASGDNGGAGGGGTSLSIEGSGSVSANSDKSSGIHVHYQGGTGGSGGDSGPIGGSGGHGGDGGVGPSLVINNTGNWSIATNGASLAPAIRVDITSGNGGNAGSGAGSGGHGGIGGAGAAPAGLKIGTADLGNWSVRTSGTDSPGLHVSSQAGRGGNGAGSGTSTGGRGAAGGRGGDLEVMTGPQANINVLTEGARSPGALLTTAGGNGGTGGQSDLHLASGPGGGPGGDGGHGGGIKLGGRWIADTFGNGNSDSPALHLSSQAGHGGSGGQGIGASGGVGGAGGTGGDVRAWDVAGGGPTVFTEGARSSGLLFESHGGNGGNGGNATCCNGGLGGNAGNGGAIVLGNPQFGATLRTRGNDANGVFLVSQGGTGGNGGDGHVGGAGKTGGGGGGGGAIAVDGHYTIETTGARSSGVVVQSLGGTGGKGGDGGFFNPRVGGGGSTGPSGPVTVNVGGTIDTAGPASFGIFAQSVAGHGGAAANSGGLIAFSASGGSAGDGAPVAVTSSADIRTRGEQSIAIAAESIGGGGGHAGDSFGFVVTGGGHAIGGKGGHVEIHNTGTLTTAGSDASALHAQSIGGGGGNGGVSIGFFALGGASANGGDADAVVVTNRGQIVAGAAAAPQAGDGPLPTVKLCGDGCSRGIFAQSVGGGGGSAGTGFGWFSLGTDGSAGGGGRGGAVSVDNQGSIRTELGKSPAIFAQSLGGGGGVGFGSGAIGVILAAAVGGKGGTGGDAGPVTVTSTAALDTRGTESPGIHAQSVGGGGGHGGFAVSAALGPNTPAISVAVGGSGGVAGDGGEVRVDALSQASIATAGKRSSGIDAQSIGGGGGSGGFSIAASAAVGELPVVLSVGVGGGAGAGGKGAPVHVASNAAIATSGAESSGILAQSLGGGGGHGGFEISLAGAVKELGAFAIGVGGAGNRGGAASAVEVHQDGSTLTTQGQKAHGIDAQSVGGGGGAGAFAVDVGFAKLRQVAVAVGGSGGSAGAGANVLVQNSSAITTTGPEANGIFAQSVSDGGGHGGLSFSGGLIGAAGGGGASVSVGGSGGGGGATSGIVTVNNRGDLVTHGGKSRGIQAQSLGGGGGEGGAAIVVAGAAGTVSAGVSVGGSGGGGGGGGAVSVLNSGSIRTGVPVSAGANTNAVPDTAHGIFAQSVGGGGGTGGFAGVFELGGRPANETLTLNATVTVGGSGGRGGTGGKVNVDNGGAIATALDESHAIFAQSIGGGGGAGGMTINATGLLEQSPSIAAINVAVGVGGHGGSGAVAGPVSVSNRANLDTTGAGSHGIYAHSVGGGGGSGGSVRTFALTAKQKGGLTNDRSVHVRASIGGFGGTANHGDTVTVDNSGAIHTRGAEAFGIYAYSIGGGGGDGGDAGGIPFVPGVDQVTRFKNVSFSLGGFEGAQGDGGAVTVTHRGASISTEGPGAPAIFAQSVGGGGGRGGSGSGGLTSPSIAVGGVGNAGGDGGNVTVNVLDGASITTTGKPDEVTGGAFGIFAQSVGGGGGVGGNARLFGLPEEAAARIKFCQDSENDFVRAVCGQTTIGIGLPMVGPGGGGGKGGNVNVTVRGNITTTGDHAAGIFAQSVGGGGGILGASGQVPGTITPFIPLNTVLIGSGPAGGSAGAVTVDYVGTINTSGDGAHGIIAQSAGGGLRAPEGDTRPRSLGGDVKINFSGRLQATGRESFGILAQSAGGDGNGNIEITVAPGSFVSGGRKGETNNGAGVMVRDGRANLLTNFGTITSADRIAVAYKGNSKLSVVNHGSIIGDVLGGASVSSVLNAAGALIEADLVDLGGGPLHNDGTILPGGHGQVAVTRLNGTLVQGPSGQVGIDLDHRLRGTAGHADLLHAAGPMALGGKIRMNMIDPGPADTGEHTVTILRSDDVVTAAGLSVDSAVAQSRLVQPSPHEIALVYAIDFANPAILGRTNDNADRLAQHIQAIYRAGALDPRIGQALIGVESADYVRVMDSFTPEVAVDNLITSLFASRRFSDGLHSCAQPSGEYRFIAEGQCVWSRIEGHTFRQSATGDNVGYRDEWLQAAVGGQMAVGTAWHLGAGLSWEGHQLRTKSAATSDGDLVNLGFSAKRRFDALELSATLASGYGSYDLRRPLAIGGAVRADQDVWSVGGHVRAAYLLGGNAWFVTPRVDVGVEWLSMPGFRESGSSPFALRVRSQSDTYYTVQPAVEIGTEFAVGGGMQIRPRLTAAVTQFLGDPSASVSASFASAPAGAGTFKTRTDLDRTRFEGALGADLFGIGGLVFRGDVFGTASGNSRGYGGSVKLEIPF